MRCLLTLIAAASLVAIATPRLRAQGEFPLKYHEAEPTDVLVDPRSFVGGSSEQPSEVKILPKDLRGGVQYFSSLIGRRMPVILEGGLSARLFVDTTGKGDFSNIAALQPVTIGPRQVFGPVTVLAEDAPAPIRMRFVCYEGQYLAAAPAGYMTGEVKLGGQTYRVAIVDDSLTGWYNTVLRITDPGSIWMSEPVFAIDLDQDGRFDRTGGFGEWMPLLSAIHVGDAYYNLTLRRDGTAVRLEKSDPKFGVLDTGCPDLVMTLMSNWGIHRLSGRQGKWRLPTCWHQRTSGFLIRTDSDGTKWTLRPYVERGGLWFFEIRSGQTLSIPSGPPLNYSLEMEEQDKGHGHVSFRLWVKGRGGERYSAAVMKGEVQLPPPRVKISDVAGKVLATGQFQYGREILPSCWYGWEVPAGFKVRFRVDVEGDFGPFDISQGSPKWFVFE